MGVGDQVPPAIEQLGAKVTLIDAGRAGVGRPVETDDVIMTGVRAYERRDDLRAYNRRLLDYVNAGGTMIVNYNKTEFNGSAATATARVRADRRRSASSGPRQRSRPCR